MLDAFARSLGRVCTRSANWLLRVIGGNLIQLSISSRGTFQRFMALKTSCSISMYCLSSRSITTFTLLDGSATVQTAEEGGGGELGVGSSEVGGAGLD